MAKRKKAGLAKIPSKKLAVVKQPEDKTGIEKWHWSKLRRRVLDMRIKGSTIRQIATVVGRNKNTILAWVNAPEFQAALTERELDQGNATATRRKYAQRVLLDQVTERMFVSLERFKEIQEEEYKAARAGNALEGKKLDENFRKQQQFLNTFTTASREFNTMRTQERLDMGQATENKRIHHSGLPAAAPIMGVSMDEFVNKYRDRLPAPKKGQDEGEALIETSRAILQNTDILEEIAAIDAEQMSQDRK